MSNGALSYKYNFKIYIFFLNKFKINLEFSKITLSTAVFNKLNK